MPLPDLELQYDQASEVLPIIQQKYSNIADIFLISLLYCSSLGYGLQTVCIIIWCPLIFYLSAYLESEAVFVFLAYCIVWECVLCGVHIFSKCDFAYYVGFDILLFSIQVYQCDVPCAHL
jgi:hypothetical protein